MSWLRAAAVVAARSRSVRLSHSPVGRLAGRVSRRLGAVLFVALVGSLSLGGAAQAQLTMAPSIVVLETRRGATATFRLGIGNGTETPQECSINASDMVLSPVGAPHAVESDARGCGAWIAFDPQSFTLAPGASQGVVCNLKAPRGADYGGHYALVSCLVKAVGAEGEGTGAVIRFGFRLDSAVLVTVLGGQLQARIEPAGVRILAAQDLKDEQRRGAKGWVAEVLVRNSGNVHDMVTGELRILTEQGPAVARVPLEAGRGWVLAGSERLFTASGSQSLPDGVYLLQARFNAGRRIVGTTSQTFSIHEGKAQPGEPSEALRAAIEASRPVFILQPERFYFEAPARGRRSQVIRVLNLTERTLELESRALPWSQDELGNNIFPAQPPGGRFLPQALTITPATVKIPPLSGGSFVVTFAFPPGADGEYYLALALAQPGETLTDDAYLLGQRTVLVTAAAKGTLRPQAEITAASETAQEGGGYQFEVTLENTGNSRCAGQGEIQVARGSETIDRLSFGAQDVLLLAGGKRTFSVTWPRVLEAGSYTATITARYAEGKQATRELKFQVAKQEPAGAPEASAPAPAPPDTVMESEQTE